MPMTYRTDLLTLCDALSTAGIWLTLNAEGALVAGPASLVARYPALLAQLKTHKADITQLLTESLAHSLFGEHGEDVRFDREPCPECGRQIQIVLGPRRLAVHRGCYLALRSSNAGDREQSGISEVSQLMNRN